MTRIVATPRALDAMVRPRDAIVLRVAPDEVLISALVTLDAIGDPHAIVERDTAWHGVWMDVPDAMAFLERACEWELPYDRPAFAQGAVADLPVKLWIERERVLVVVPSPFASELDERMRWIVERMR
jgi:hypothetical protein